MAHVVAPRVAHPAGEGRRVQAARSETQRGKPAVRGRRGEAASRGCSACCAPAQPSLPLRSPDVASRVGGAGGQPLRHALDERHKGAAGAGARGLRGGAEGLPGRRRRRGGHGGRQHAVPHSAHGSKAGVALLAVGQRKSAAGLWRRVVVGSQVSPSAQRQPAAGARGDGIK